MGQHGLVDEHQVRAAPPAAVEDGHAGHEHRQRREHERRAEHRPHPDSLARIAAREQDRDDRDHRLGHRRADRGEDGADGALGQVELAPDPLDAVGEEFGSGEDDEQRDEQQADVTERHGRNRSGGAGAAGGSGRRGAAPGGRAPGDRRSGPPPARPTRCGARGGAPAGAVALPADAPHPERPVGRAHRPDRRRGDARPGRDRHGDPRRRRCASGCSSRPAARCGRPRSCSRATSWSGPSPSAPSSFWLYDRDGNPHADLGGDRVHFVPGSSRPARARPPDRRDAPRELDRLRRVRPARRRPRATSPISRRRSRRTTTSRPQVSDAWRLYLMPDELEEAGRLGRLHRARRAADGRDDGAVPRRDRADLIARPMSIFTITATGNFRYSEDSCQNMIDCVEAGIPVEIVPVTLMGLIAPVTLVGATVFHTVDVLAGITMAQVVRPGAPVLFGGAPATFHMKIAIVADGRDRGAPARRRLRRGRQVARACRPSRTWRCRTAKILDAQAGAETFGSALLAALAGVNSVSRSRDARLPARLQPAQAGVRRRGVRPGAPLRARGRGRSTTCRSATRSTS